MNSRDLDRFDRNILKILSVDGRISWRELAERVSLSQTPTLRRVRMLEADGFISGYRAVVDESRMGLDVSVFISVSLEKQTDEALANFEAKVAELPAVMDCFMMSGDADYLMRVALPDIKTFQSFVSNLTRIPGVARINSSFAVKSVVQRASPVS